MQTGWRQSWQAGARDRPITKQRAGRPQRTWAAEGAGAPELGVRLRRVGPRAAGQAHRAIAQRQQRLSRGLRRQRAGAGGGGVRRQAGQRQGAGGRRWAGSGGERRRGLAAANWGLGRGAAAPLRRTLRSWKWASSERCSCDSPRCELHSWARWGQPPQGRFPGEPMPALPRRLLGCGGG